MRTRPSGSRQGPRNKEKRGLASLRPARKRRKVAEENAGRVPLDVAPECASGACTNRSALQNSLVRSRIGRNRPSGMT